MIDTKAFHAMSYGVYIVSTLDGERPVGCVVNTLAQVTSTPPRMSVAVNKDNHTADCIRRTGRFAAVCLEQDATMELIGAFGFRTSADEDKFAAFATAYDEAGMPYVDEQACARFSVKVAETIDVGTHWLFVGDVEESQVLSSAAPLTYAHYHAVKGGKTPPKASSYDPDEAAAKPAADAPAAGGRVAWRCTVCGHIEYVDELPDDFTCPLCGVGKDMFERIIVPE